MMPGPEITALRALFGELLQLPGTAEHIAHLMAGSDVRYDTGDDHPLAGLLMPDLTLSDGRRAAELLHQARPVLLDLTGGRFADTPREAGATASTPWSPPARTRRRMRC